MGEKHSRTVGGLLRKRAELMDEALALRERLAVISNDFASLNRVLQVFGHEDDGEVADPVRNRNVMFHRNELRLYVLQEFRDDERISSRELASRLITAEGRDGHDKRLLLDVIKRVGKAMQSLKSKGVVANARCRDGRVVWFRTKPHPSDFS